MQAMLEPKQSPETVGFNKAWLNDILKKGMSRALHGMLSNPVSRFKNPNRVSGSDGCRAQATSGGRQAWCAKEPGRRAFMSVQASMEQFAVYFLCETPREQVVETRQSSSASLHSQATLSLCMLTRDF